MTLPAPNPYSEAFSGKYQELKSQKVHELDRYLTVISKIVGDKDLLAAVSRPQAPEAWSSGSGASGSVSVGDSETSALRGADAAHAAPAVSGPSVASSPLMGEAGAGGAIPITPPSVRPGSDATRYTHMPVPEAVPPNSALGSQPMDSFMTNSNPLASPSGGGGGAAHTPGVTGFKGMLGNPEVRRGAG